MKRESSPTHQLVSIIGNIGSGKSTALPMISDALHADQIDADNLFQTTNPYKDRYLADVKTWAFENEKWMTLARVKIIRDYLAQAEKKQIGVIDSGLLMSWAYANGHFQEGNFSDVEWQKYLALYDKVAMPLVQSTTVVRLEYPIATLFSRIRRRGRQYELDWYSAHYLQQIERGLDALESKLLAHGVPILKVTEQVVSDFENDPEGKQKFLQMVMKFMQVSSTDTERTG